MYHRRAASSLFRVFIRCMCVDILWWAARCSRVPSLVGGVPVGLEVVSRPLTWCCIVLGLVPSCTSCLSSPSSPLISSHPSPVASCTSFCLDSVYLSYLIYPLSSLLSSLLPCGHPRTGPPSPGRRVIDNQHSNRYRAGMTFRVTAVLHTEARTRLTNSTSVEVSSASLCLCGHLPSCLKAISSV
jgi:hypothetical protein